MMSSAVLVLTAAVLGVTYLVHKFNTRISPGIPYAGSPTPTRDPTLLERLRAAQEYGKDPVAFLCKTRNILGDVFCVDLLVMKFVFLVGPDGNKEIFRAAEDKLSFDEAIKWSLGPVFAETYEYPGWTEPSMKILRAGLLRQDRIDAYYAMCTGLTESCFQELAKKESVPLFESISHVIIANLIMLLAGENVYSRHGDELVPLMAQFESAMQKPILRVVPWAVWRFTEPGKTLFAICSRFDKIMADEMRDILAHPEKHASRDDYFYSIVSQMGAEFEPCYGRHIMAAVFAGHANVAMTIPWLFLHARRIPGALEKIREEIILPHDAPKPYLEACFRETGRLYSNTTVFRLTQETVLVAGHLIPKGTLLAASPLATQRADATENGAFTSAGKWNPMRFLEPPMGTGAEGDEPVSVYSEYLRRGEFVHFGMGQHVCPGEKMARMLIFDLVLKTLLEKYDMEVLSGLEEGVKGVDGLGAEGAWTEENFGTPSIRGEDVTVSIRQRCST